MTLDDATDRLYGVGLAGEDDRVALVEDPKALRFDIARWAVPVDRIAALRGVSGDIDPRRLGREAEKLLRSARGNASDAVLKQIVQGLRAAAVSDEGREQLARGTFVRPPDETSGFGLLSELVGELPEPSPAKQRREEDRRAKADLREARKRLREAEAELRKAEADERKAERDAQAAAERADAARQEVERLKRALET